jgi:hypothetical protein
MCLQNVIIRVLSRMVIENLYHPSRQDIVPTRITVEGARVFTSAVTQHCKFEGQPVQVRTTPGEIARCSVCGVELLRSEISDTGRR